MEWLRPGQLSATPPLTRKGSVDLGSPIRSRFDLSSAMSFGELHARSLLKNPKQDIPLALATLHIQVCLPTLSMSHPWRYLN